MKNIVTVIQQGTTKFYLKATLLSVAISVAVFLVYELTNFV